MTDDKKPGDDQIRDVAEGEGSLFGDPIDQLIRELWPACGPDEREELRSMLPDAQERAAPALEEAQIRLEDLRGRLLGEARDRRWEGPPGRA